MELAPGVQLHQRWPTMDGREKVKCIEGIIGK